jgi:hypothetical protein
MVMEIIFVAYPSYFKLLLRWLHLLTRITYQSKLIGIPSFAALIQLELFRVITRHTSSFFWLY